MAVITQDNPYKVLIRKIGYSVGLEDLLWRVTKLTNLYVENRGLSLAMFADLVNNNFSRQTDPRHFADFYGTLNLVRVIRRSLDVLYVLDTLSILRRLFTNDDKRFTSALVTVLTQSILEADGDIFLNALEVDFEAPKVKLQLEKMIYGKRDLITRHAIKSLDLIEDIYRIIDIESFEPKQKSVNNNLKKESSRFEVRRTPLDDDKRITSLSAAQENVVHISDDYLRKAPPRRKKWAEDLELFSGNEKTLKGQNLLNTLGGKLRFKQSSDYYTFWPYSHDLAKIQIKPEDIDFQYMNAWDLLCSIGEATSSVTVLPCDDEENHKELIDLLHYFYELYREGNVVQGKIRHQLPIYIAEPCLVSYCVANSRNIPDLPNILNIEGKKPFRRIQRIIIRGTEGAIVFKEKK